MFHQKVDTMIRVLVYLLALCFCGGANSLCVDKNALYSINATVHLSMPHSGMKVSNVNFYTLEKYIAIDVTQANVTDLCEGIVKNFMNLEVLSLINVNLSKIQPEAFQKVPKLRELSLAVNHLTAIAKGSFNNLDALEVLYLSANEIATIEENSFASLPNLREVHLDRNKLTELNGNLFHASPSLRLLDFRFNSMGSITKASFQDLRPSHGSPVEVLLSANRIAEVDPATFGMPNPVVLHLEGNQLKTTSDLLHGLREFSKVYLNGNRLTCLPDDVIETMRNTTKDLVVEDNPLDCDCMDRIETKLDEVFGNGVLRYSSTFPCQFVRGYNFG